MRRFSLASFVAVAALIATSGSAGAATQIGQTFEPTTRCGSVIVMTLLQREYTVPSDGVITRWNFEASPVAPQRPSLKFKVARPAGGTNFTVIGESAVVAPVTGPVSTFSVQISVKRGDVIGFSVYINGYCDRPQPGYTELMAPGDVFPINTTAFSDTAEGYREPASGQNRQMDLSAALEPDCDKDGLGDETQDQSLGGCPTCKGKRSTIVGKRGNDVLSGTPGRDVMAGKAGNDKLSGLAGNDLICGGGGNDKLNGGTGKDALLGQGGKDTCKGGKGKDSASACEVEKSI
jgi:hypothetical protein